MVRMVFEYNPECDMTEIIRAVDESLKNDGWEKTNNPNEYVIYDDDASSGSILGIIMTFASNEDFANAIDKWLLYGVEGAERDPIDGKQEYYTSKRKPKKVR